MQSFQLKGFYPKDITPYLHWFHVHLPYSVKQFGGLDKLSGELLEAQNDQIKKTHLRRTHHKDPKMTLRMEKRRELQEMAFEVDALQHAKPRKRKLGNQHPYFAHGIREREMEKRTQNEVDCQTAMENQKGDYDDLSNEKLKGLIYERSGARPKIRNREKLLNQLWCLDEEGGIVPEQGL